MKTSILFIMFASGLVAGCITGALDSAKTTDANRLPATAEVTPGELAVSADGAMIHEEECEPVAESRHVGAPSIEIGVTTPVGNYATYSGPFFYSRYVCH